MPSVVLLDWQLDDEEASLSGLAGHPDVATVQRRQALGECQPETGSFVKAPCSRVQLLEFLEQAAEVRLGDPDSGVGDRDLDGLVMALRGDRDGSAVGRELDRVGDKVEQHLPQLARIRLHLASSLLRSPYPLS